MNTFPIEGSFVISRLELTDEKPHVAVFDVTFTLSIGDSIYNIVWTNCALFKRKDVFSVQLPDEQTPDKSRNAPQQLTHHLKGTTLLTAITQVAEGNFLDYENAVLREQKAAGATPLRSKPS